MGVHSDSWVVLCCRSGKSGALRPGRGGVWSAPGGDDGLVLRGAVAPGAGGLALVDGVRRATGDDARALAADAAAGVVAVAVPPLEAIQGQVVERHHVAPAAAVGLDVRDDLDEVRVVVEELADADPGLGQVGLEIALSLHLAAEVVEPEIGGGVELHLLQVAQEDGGARRLEEPERRDDAHVVHRAAHVDEGARVRVDRLHVGHAAGGVGVLGVAVELPAFELDAQVGRALGHLRIDALGRREEGDRAEDRLGRLQDLEEKSHPVLGQGVLDGLGEELLDVVLGEPQDVGRVDDRLHVALRLDVPGAVGVGHAHPPAEEAVEGLVHLHGVEEGRPPEVQLRVGREAGLEVHRAGGELGDLDERIVRAVRVLGHGDDIVAVVVADGDPRTVDAHEGQGGGHQTVQLLHFLSLHFLRARFCGRVPRTGRMAEGKVVSTRVKFTFPSAQRP